ncbi:MAG TPA: pilus assembly protein N-terminal domain-containing protein [Pirellulales bacterium]|jgi:pilus assembly protein CpaC|nr:pilus assembly protein N-terminal domain-containing protein [Pirellulales bacterium]
MFPASFSGGFSGLRMAFRCAAVCCCASLAQAQQSNRNPIVHKVESASDRLEMVVNSSRILTLDQKIPRAQVNNPEIMSLTPLSPSQVQISAKKPGVTEINLWTENDEIRTVDVIVYGDARELEMIIKTQFPSATIKVIPTASSVVLSGFVDRADHVDQIIRIAEDYYPKVIPNITVGGVQQILLHVKVMEVSRTKLRQMGFDFSNLNGNNFVVSSVSGLISAAANGASGTGTGSDTVRFGVMDGKNSFFGFLSALRQYDLAKVLAEPTLVTVSGRPAFFNSGGEFPVLVPQSLGTISIEYKKYGTQIDFVPVVLGNGNIRLEVRPRVSEVDDSRSVTTNGITVPGLRVREVDTGVEMQAGQTLAIAGLVQERTESTNAGLPYLADIPYFGVPFRRVKEQKNEIELVILVQPELVEALDAGEVPHVGPGLQTVSPTDCELYFKGHLEVPACNLPGAPATMRGPVYEELPPSQTPSKPAAKVTPTSTASTSRPASGYAVANPPPASPGVRLGSAANAARNNGRTLEAPAYQPAGGPPRFIGPLGYDVNND